MAGDRITTYSRAGLTFEVRDEGPIDGDVVLLLHGFPQLNSSWDLVAPLLHDQGLRTLAPNQRGYSPGARPPGRRPYRTGELVKDVLALAELSGGPVHLAGHDWGAAVAWAAAIVAPDTVRSLTAVSVPHPGAFMAAMPRGQALDSWYMALFNLPWLPERLLADARTADRFLLRGGMTREMVATYHRDIVDGGALRGGLGWYRALPLSNPRLFKVHVQVPTTYVWSDRDAALGRTGAELCEKYVDGPYTFEVIEGASHWLLDERPEEIAEAILHRIDPAREA
jgi:pimeloyl-ACP methyl ester carboxylesterase